MLSLCIFGSRRQRCTIIRKAVSCVPPAAPPPNLVKNARASDVRFRKLVGSNERSCGVFPAVCVRAVFARLSAPAARASRIEKCLCAPPAPFTHRTVNVKWRTRSSVAAYVVKEARSGATIARRRRLDRACTLELLANFDRARPHARHT